MKGHDKDMDIQGHSPYRLAIKQLFALSGNRCAFPGCEIEMVDYETKTALGEICHICGRQPTAPRHDKTQTESERNAYPNLLLLCGTHHKLVDSNPKRYTVELLKKMKTEHEDEIKKRIGMKAEVEDWVVNVFVGTGHGKQD